MSAAEKAGSFHSILGKLQVGYSSYHACVQHELDEAHYDPRADPCQAELLTKLRPCCKRHCGADKLLVGERAYNTTVLKYTYYIVLNSCTAAGDNYMYMYIV